jgi:hypothetical protein
VSNQTTGIGVSNATAFQLDKAKGAESMIKELNEMPPGVTGFEATGKLRAEDYRDVVLPALERAAATGEVRFLIVMNEFDGMTGGALWQDLKVGFEHLRSWKRIALVTDIEWMHHLTDLFGWMTPGETKAFSAEQRDAAIAWVAG